METQVPRRALEFKQTEEEKAIDNAITQVEKLGADSLLTDCVMLLQNAKNRLSDYVDANL